MTCKIDHSDPEAIPRIICRLCSSPWMCEPVAPALAPAVAPAGDDAKTWPHKVRRDNLTPADLRAIAEITGQQEREQAREEAEKAARFAEFKQWCKDNPELVKARREAKRAARQAEKRIGVKATGKIFRRKRSVANGSHLPT